MNLRTFALALSASHFALPLHAQQEWTVSTGPWSGSEAVVVARDEPEWKSLWSGAAGAGPAPAVDFGRSVVTGAFFDGGYILRRQPTPPRRERDEWDFALSFGPSRTAYMPTDIKVKTSDMDVVFKNVMLRERHSMEYYDFTKNPQPLRAFDEPTNAFRLTARNKTRRLTAYLQLFHPKFLVSAPGLNDSVTAVGTVQGKHVDGPMDINAVFPKYQLTYGLVNISLGAEKEIPIVSGKGGSLVYAPGAAIGVFIGSSDAVLRDPAEANNYKEFRAQRLKPIGASVSLTHRLTYEIPGERLNLSVSHAATAGKIEYGILDGRAQQNLSYQNINVAVGFKVYGTKRRKKPIDRIE